MGYLFQEYDIKKVPQAVILNTNLDTLKKVTNFSPADLLINISELENVFQDNQLLEKEKYESIAKQHFYENNIHLFEFEFSNVNQEENLKIKEFLVKNKLSFKSLKKEIFKE